MINTKAANAIEYKKKTLNVFMSVTQRREGDLFFCDICCVIILLISCIQEERAEK